MHFLKKHWRLILPFAVMFAIFLFSADPPSSSDAKSLFFSEFLNLSTHLTRKIAHFIIFALLGATWYNYIRNYGGFTPGFTAFLPIALTTFYALIDEYHQTFVPGRSGQLSDVALDSAAGVIGVGIFALFFYLSRSEAQKNARKEQIKAIWHKNQTQIQKIRKLSQRVSTLNHRKTQNYTKQSKSK